MKSVLNGRTLFAFLSLALAATACSKSSPTPTTTVSAENVRTNTTATDSYVNGVRVTRNDTLQTLINGITILSAANGDASRFLKTSPAVDPRTIYGGTFPTSDTTLSTIDPTTDTLMVGLPIGNLGEERILGGIITKVSATTNEGLGSLKLSDFPMLHGKLMLANLNGNAPQLIFVGCANQCKESSARVPLIALPIAAVDTVNGLMMIDLSAVGRDLDFMAMEDPNGEGTGLKSTGSVTTAFDYSQQTIVFDIDSKMTAVDSVNNPLPDTTITVRWYLKSSAAFDSAFIQRAQTPGVGFFTTDTAANEKIKRWSLAQYGNQGIKYYIKNVPAEWQPAFASAFDEWNKEFVTNFGRKIFDYEFIPENDPRNALLVTGDIRYNIVEWDLVNAATYGGLGPSEGNEYTGETISANVLIQGPTVMKLYTDWYHVSAQAKALSDAGKTEAAAKLMRDYSASVDANVKTTASARLTLGKNKARSFTIQSARPELADPLAQRNDFDALPANVDFKTYMNGYFHDMLTHELGHNLGLRHNFRGNLGATDAGTKGSTSRSVMEYLGRGFRYLDQVGEYDVMALKYGYSGVKPTHLDWFCTDEDNWKASTPGASAECTSDDATSDPYAFFEARLARSLDYLIARGESFAPVWNQNDLARELGIALKGLESYATTEDAAAKAFTNFYGKPDRPAVDSASTKTYVIARVKQQLCDPGLELVISGKADPAAQDATRKAIVLLRETAIQSFAKVNVDLGFDINCQSQTTPMAMNF